MNISKKSMKVLVDTNVLMDFFAKRKGFAEDAKNVIILCKGKEKRVDGYIAAHSIMDMCYILLREQTQEERMEMIKRICKVFTVIETTADTIIAEAERMDFKDFEDSVVNQAAIKASVNYIITRNIKDFKMSDVTVITPRDFLEMINSSDGNGSENE